METPLDVLSRAASMVETSQVNGDHSLKRCSPVDTRESPSKELPTKILKLDRLKERQDLIHSKRCTGTQTQISNVDRDLYMNGDRHMIGHNSYSVPHAGLLSQTSHHLPLPPRGSPPPYKPIDNHDVPLNLSLSNLSHSSGSSSSSFQQLQQSSSHVPRPSVITCASSADHRLLPPYSANPSLVHIESREPHHVMTTSGQRLPSPPNQREVSSDEVCDPAIEEHFRRSLGRDYSDIMSQKSAVSPVPAPAPPMVVATPSPPPPPPSAPTESVAMTKNNGNPAVSITGSVDDHFAKSLGNSTWSAIKAKNDPIHDLFPGSVDDHFAKALGDTWLRIKAEKESGINTHSPSQNASPSPQQRHDSSLLST